MNVQMRSEVLVQTWVVTNASRASSLDAICTEVMHWPRGPARCLRQRRSFREEMPIRCLHWLLVSVAGHRQLVVKPVDMDSRLGFLKGAKQ